MVRDRDFGCEFAVRSGVASGIRLPCTTHKIYTPFSSIKGVIRDLAAASQLGNLYRICGTIRGHHITTPHATQHPTMMLYNPVA